MIFFSAILLGLLSSWHCIGMCGPLAIAVNHAGGQGKWQGSLIYHSGRILVYACMGLIMGLIGITTVILEVQQYFSILLAVVVLILIFKQAWLNKLTAKYQQSRFMNFMKRRLLNKRNFRSPQGKFIAGIANGFLPCGMVYVALAGAVAQQRIEFSIAYMVLFGLGTFPALLLTNFIPLKWTAKPIFRKWAFAGMLIISCLLFYRALYSHTPSSDSHRERDKGSVFENIPLCSSL